MQVDNMSMNSKWASTGRVPPLDLSGVTNCPRETERRWHHIKPVVNMIAHPKAQHPHQLHQHQHQQQQQQHTFHHQQDTSSTHLPFEFVHGADGLPIDPRDWTRADVWSWLTNLAMSEGLQPHADLAQKFPMNGKALCLMSLDMYLARVPHGGKMLYRDFRVRLARAMSL